MRDKVMAAKTPVERTRLMQEHAKAMEDGMGMMGRMRAGKGGMVMRSGMNMHPEVMGKRMDMMQMMMDREAMKPPAAK